MNPPTIASGTLVEAIARAMSDDPLIDRVPIERLRVKWAWAYAQAALTAITEAGFVVCPREPTEAMIKVGVETECGLGPYTLPDVIAASYRAMIDVVTHCNHTNNGKAE